MLLSVSTAEHGRSHPEAQMNTARWPHSQDAENVV